MPSLSALLVSRRLVDLTALRRAMVRQVVAGGTLDTALLEQTAVRESDLLELLELATDFPSITNEVFSLLSSRVADAVPLATAEKLGICPVCWTRGRLVVLTTEQVNFIALDELSFDMGVELIPRSSTELRVMQARATVYQQPIPERFVRLLELRGLSLDPVEIEIPIELEISVEIEIPIELELEKPPATQRYLRYLTAEERALVERQQQRCGFTD